MVLCIMNQYKDTRASHKLRTNFRRYLWLVFFTLDWLLMTQNNTADIFQAFMVFSALQLVIKRSVATCETRSKA